MTNCADKEIKEKPKLLGLPSEYRSLCICFGIDLFCTAVFFQDIYDYEWNAPWFVGLFLARSVCIYFATSAIAKENNLIFILWLFVFIIQLSVLCMKTSFMIFSPLWEQESYWSGQMTACICCMTELGLLSNLQMEKEKAKTLEERKQWKESRGKEFKDEEADAKYSAWDLIAKVGVYFIPHFRETGIMIVGLVICNVTGNLKPYLQAQIIDGIIEKNIDDLPTTMVYLCSVMCINCAAHYVQAYYQRHVREHVEFDMRVDVFKAVMRCETGYFDENTSGEVTAVAVHSVAAASNWFGWEIRCFVEAIVNTMTILTLSFTMDTRLSICSLLIGHMVMIRVRYFNSHTKRLDQKKHTQWEDCSKIATEAVSNIRTVKTFGCEGYEFNDFVGLLNQTMVTEMQSAWYCETRWAVCNFVPQVSMLMVFYFATCMVVRGELTVGQVYAFMSYSRFLAWMFHILGDKFRSFSRILVKTHKVFKLLERECELPRTGEHHPSVCKGELHLENITYNYPTKPDKPVLKDFNLKVNAGELVALVGESGCGKSTIIKLLGFLYGPNKEQDKGSVLLDGVPVSDYSADAFKKFVVAVPQEPVLFARSLRENISYGEDCTLEEVILAAKSANAHDFIMKLDKGYDSVVGERGLTLSGGERQRISIARALVRRPTVLLLDEATASLDSKSERLVHEAIDRIIDTSTNGMTVVVVAHRLSTVKNADRIIVMEAGEIAEEGTHTSLIEKSGIYAGFVAQQFLEDKKDEEDVSEENVESKEGGIADNNVDSKDSISAETENCELAPLKMLPKNSLESVQENKE